MGKSSLSIKIRGERDGRCRIGPTTLRQTKDLELVACRAGRTPAVDHQGESEASQSRRSDRWSFGNVFQPWLAAEWTTASNQKVHGPCSNI